MFVVTVRMKNSDDPVTFHIIALQNIHLFKQTNINIPVTMLLAKHVSVLQVFI